MNWTGSGSKVCKTGHLKSCWDEVDKIEETFYPQDDIPPVRIWLESYNVLPDVVIYTDGSKMEDMKDAHMQSVKVMW